MAQEYVDAEPPSGTTAPAGEMVAYLKAHPSVRVMRSRRDRAYRNLKDWGTWTSADGKNFPKGVVLARVALVEKFSDGIKELMAKNYIDNLSEEARKGMQEKAEQGIWPTKPPLVIATSRPEARRSSRRHDVAPIVTFSIRNAAHLRKQAAKNGRRQSASPSARARKAHPSTVNDPTQPAVHWPVRVERQADPRQA